MAKGRRSVFYTGSVFRDTREAQVALGLSAKRKCLWSGPNYDEAQKKGEIDLLIARRFLQTERGTSEGKESD